MDTLLRDLRQSLRKLRNAPVFTAVALLTLALGIGANTTVFTIANGVLLKPLPFKNPERIMYIAEVERGRGRGTGVSSPDLLDLKAQNRSFTGLASFGTGTYNISDDLSAPERVAGSRVSANFFPLIGQPPILGRDFAPQDDDSVVIIGYGLWQSRYGGAADIVGRTLRSNGIPHTIIGVVPRGMKFPIISEIWLPSLPVSDRSGDRAARSSEVFGRLRDGVSLGQARADSLSISRRIAAEHPETNKNIDFSIVPYASQFTGGETRNVMLALLGAVGFLLLIVCANLANLLLTRAVHRTRETAIRLAIGASRWNILRQLLIESLLLSCAGGLLGFAFSISGLKVITEAAKTARLPYWVETSMDYRVFFYFAGVCVIAGVLFGLAPALQIAGINVIDRLKNGGAGTMSSRSRRWTSVLVTAEIALTLVLLVNAGLMIRSLLKFRTIDVGVPTHDMLFANLILPPPMYASPTARVGFEERLMETLRSRPGLTSVTLASHGVAGAPGGAGANWQTAWTENATLPEIGSIVVVPGYFQAIGAAIVRGRDFSSSDGTPGNEAIIVNARFASRQWPGEDPLGKRVRLRDKPDAPWLTVIGVSSNMHVEDEIEFPPVVYIPYRQEPTGLLVMTVRTPAPELALKTLRTEIQKLDPDLPLFNVMTIEEYKDQLSVGLRLLRSLFTTFAAIALLISTIGVYAVTAYAVGQRTREIGIRIAVGANRLSVVWLVARESLIQLGLGLILGLFGALATTRLLAGHIFQIAPTDGPTFIAIFTLLSAATLAASLIPARRALAIDPATALRPE